MGWCSGTYIFDNMAKFVLESNQPDEAKYQTLLSLANSLEEQDWDCQTDSGYYAHPVVQRIMRELHPGWFKEEIDD